MDTLLYYICIPFGMLMKLCWYVVKNYGAAIILFTLAVKLVLIPVSVWIHKNSILMVKLQPEINFIKAKYYGDADMIADEQSRLFKKHKYRPMLTLVPLAIQVVLLMAVVVIIYHPLEYLLGFPRDAVNAVGAFIGVSSDTSSLQLDIVRAIQSGAVTEQSVIDGVSPNMLADICTAVRGLDLKFFVFDISVIPSSVWGMYCLVPIIAGFSAWLLCFTQNRSNVIQHEQGLLSKYGLTVLSVALSLYLGCFVPSGIALYWIVSNLFAIVQMYVLNALISPKKYVDYDALEKSRAALHNLELLGKNDGGADKKENKKRERRDFKKFFGIVNKHLVIYSEKSGFYKYFEDIINALERRSDIIVHYVTNDPDDAVFALAEKKPFIKPYYVGVKKTIPLMMRLEADIVLMTTPDFDKLYIKRSIMKKDAEYIYVPHDMMSVHTGFREGAFDEFDTVFCTGEHTERELRAMEKYYGTREKTLVKFGYPLADKLSELAKQCSSEKTSGGRKKILIAPSWQEDNLLDSCIDGLLDGLLCDEYSVTVRPHPEYVKRYGARMNAIVSKYADRVGEGLSFELDFSDNSSVYSSDLLITDWSGIAPEFSFATGRPSLFINTKFKFLNPNWEKIGCEPVEISLRNQIGETLGKDELCGVADAVRRLLDNTDEYSERIKRIFETHIYNHGRAGDAGAKYILSRLTNKNK